MALTQADVDRLEQAVARGELTVEYDGRRITYRSMDELLKAVAYVKGAVAAQSATAPSDRQSFAAFNRGLCG